MFPAEGIEYMKRQTRLDAAVLGISNSGFPDR